MTKRMMSVALAASLFLPGAWALKASAHDEGGKGGEEHGMMGGDMGEKAKKHLGLTDDQAAKFKDAMKAHQEATKPLMRAMRDGMTKLKDQVSDKASDADIKKTLDGLKSSRQAMSDEQEKFHSALASFLTPTQQAKLVLGMAKRMHEGMMGGPGGERGEWKNRREKRGGDHAAPKDEDHDEKGK